MEIVLIWFQQLSESAKITALSLSVNNIITILYFLLCLNINKSRFLLAFLFSNFVFLYSAFDAIKSYQLYMIIFIAYSFIIIKLKTIKQLRACATIMLLSLILAIESFLFGNNGIYGQSTNIIYDNIEFIALCAHIVFIISLVDRERINNYLRRSFAMFNRLQNSNYYFMRILL